MNQNIEIQMNIQKIYLFTKVIRLTAISDRIYTVLQKKFCSYFSLEI